MVDVEAVILDELGRLAPLGGFADANWDEVVRRAGLGRAAETVPASRTPRRRRRVVLALVSVALLVVAVAVSPLGAAIGNEVSNFSSWLRGSPGKPASSAQQRTFAQGNARAWAGFPADTKLRRLIVTHSDGVTYTLFGFRSGDSLCLDVSAEGAARGSTLACAPLRELRARPQPALVLSVDYGIGTLPGKRVRIGPDVYTLNRASVSFGIVADNVKGVTLRSDDRTRQAIVASDAFLSVVNRPHAGSRVRQVRATTRDGKTVAIPFAQAPFDSTLGVTPLGTLHGPSHLDRIVHGGTIGWFARRELRGQPLPAKLPLLGFGGTTTVVFGRLVAPDPGSPIRMGLVLEHVSRSSLQHSPFTSGLYVCQAMVIGHATGSNCERSIEGWFKRGPFSFSSVTFGGGAQYTTLSGVASDQVARMRLFLSTGEVVDVPLKDNLYFVQAARAKFPIRLVAYDDHGRVIGIQSMRSDMGGPAGPAQQPAKNGHWRILTQVKRADGRAVTLWAVPSQAGGWCWKVKTPGAGEEAGCAPPSTKLGRTIRLYITPGPQAGARATLLVKAGANITNVKIRYRSGATDQARPVNGFVLYAPPPSRVHEHDTISEIDGYNQAGKQIAHVNLPGHP